ncbi:MAG: hypothetical protein J0G94_01350 [Sphingomonadales bacterium]|nr:hypothetical protein [Sphingomonadales bacterium]
MTGLARAKRRAMIALAVLALVLGVTSTGWMVAVVNQWLLPWSTFRIFLPDAGYLERQTARDSQSAAPSRPATDKRGQ